MRDSAFYVLLCKNQEYYSSTSRWLPITRLQYHIGTLHAPQHVQTMYLLILKIS